MCQNISKKFLSERPVLSHNKYPHKDMIKHNILYTIIHKEQPQNIKMKKNFLKNTQKFT